MQWRRWGPSVSSQALYHWATALPGLQGEQFNFYTMVTMQHNSLRTASTVRTSDIQDQMGTVNVLKLQTLIYLCIQIKCWCSQAFKWALLFLFFLLFPTFLICSYFSLLFHDNALLSLLFHSKMSFTGKNPDFFSRSLHSLRFYKLTSMSFREHAT